MSNPDIGELRIRLLEHDCGNRTWFTGDELEEAIALLGGRLPCECESKEDWIERWKLVLTVRYNGPGLYPSILGIK